MGCTGSKDAYDDEYGGRRRGGRGRGGRGDEELQWDGKIRPVEAWYLEPRGLAADHLHRLRREFWETRVEGKQEMWQALQAAAEADSDALRDEIVAAVGLKPASKSATLLAMYDELGALYETPIYCLRPPENLDEQPCFEEFKDAAAAVRDFCEGATASRSY